MSSLSTSSSLPDNFHMAQGLVVWTEFGRTSRLPPEKFALA